MKINVWILAVILTGIAVTPAYAWVAEPTEATGYYYMYDDEEEGPPFDYPAMPDLPDASEGEIWNNPSAYKLTCYSGWSMQYILVDSFWYFEHWYVPGNYCWFSCDGWISFDEVAVDGYPHPPSASPPFPITNDPNELIAPLWQDNNLTKTVPPADDNRLYYMWNDGDRTLTVQWHNVIAFSSDNEYDYACQLQFGGQGLLIDDSCGVTFSRHLIHFFYHSADDWSGEDGAAGIEDINGKHGLSYGGVIEDGRVIRMSYKEELKHDMAAIEIMEPETVVEPGIYIEPNTKIVNLGNYSEDPGTILNIYDDQGSRIYHVVTTYLGVGVEPGDTERTNYPYWTPGDSGEHYIAELIVLIDSDQNPANDTLIKHVWSGAAVAEDKAVEGFELNVVDINTIEFSLPYQTRAELAVYDVNGRKIRNLTNRFYPAGTHTLTWDGADDVGIRIAQGVYLVRMDADDWSKTQKLTILE